MSVNLLINRIAVRVKFRYKILGRTAALLFSIATLFLVLSACKKAKDISPEPRGPVKAKVVKLDDPNIHIGGAAYVSRTSRKLYPKRFSEATLNAPEAIRMFSPVNALSTSGISIQFKTKSAFINLTFSPESGLDEKGAFKILKDGAEFKIITFNGPVSQPINIGLNDLPTDKEAVYEIILPSYTNLSLTKLEIEEGSDLVAYQPEQKKVYLSFGDSITHGRGQDGCTYLTYPFLLAQKLNMHLYNLGIGGARVSIPVAEMSKELPQADLITILIGYNDFYGASRTAAQFEQDYRNYLTEIRRNHPSAEIYCITLLYTKTQENTKTHLTSDDFRAIVKNIVNEYTTTDPGLHLIEGDKITSSANLQPGADTDPVHLTVNGASLLAEELHKTITAQ